MSESVLSEITVDDCPSETRVLSPSDIPRQETWILQPEEPPKGSIIATRRKRSRRMVESAKRIDSTTLEGDLDLNAMLRSESAPVHAVLMSGASLRTTSTYQEGYAVPYPVPSLAETMKNIGIAATAAGYWHFMILGERMIQAQAVEIGASCFGGRVLSFGWNDYGQCGTGDNVDIEKPAPVCFPTSFTDSIASVACGGYHTVFLSTSGLVYCCGMNHYGQLGIGDTKPRSVPVLTGLSTDDEIVSVAAGGYFSVAKTSNGSLLAWGCNEDGQIAISSVNNQLLPVICHPPVHVEFNSNLVVQEGDSGSEDEGDYEDEDGGGGGSSSSSGEAEQEEGQQGDFQGVPLAVADVECKTASLLALTSDGCVFGAGSNENGELGLGDTTARLEFTEVSFEKRIVGLGGGDSHTLALSSKGEVFVFGRNDNAALGLGHLKKIKTPTLLKAFRGMKIVKVFSGRGECSFVLDEKGNLYGWGQNEKGELALSDFEMRVRPTVVTQFRHKEVKDVCFGAMNSLFVLKAD